MLIRLSFILLVLISCSNNNDKSIVFLDNFIELAKIEKDNIYKRNIQSTDLDLLLATNEVNAPLFNVDHKYYYGYKKKLDGNHYMVSYLDCYRPEYRFTHLLYNWKDLVLCIYKVKENRIVSKLIMHSSDPVYSRCIINDDVYIITSFYNKFEPIESDCNKIVLKKDSVISKYRVIKNKFTKMD